MSSKQSKIRLSLVSPHSCLVKVELRRKLMAFFETSDYFEAAVVIELMPEEENFMLKERAILMAKAKRYREALTICVD